MAEETEVIRKILAGDIESFGFIVKRYEKPVVKMIRNMIYDKDCCEDVAQDVFFTAYRKLATFDPARSRFSTWLFTIARNKSINALKKKKAFLISKMPEVSSQDNPYDDIAEKELFGELDKRLHALPFRQQRALILAEFEKLSYEEIAQIEGVRTGTIKSRINRAKEKLAKTLKKFMKDVI